MAETAVTEKTAETPDTLADVDSIAIRFAGDSGDGSQLIGGEFANTSAIIGNDISTLPDFPAEIRAPAGTLPGVSGFQVRISSEDIFTPGDEPQVLVAMNPAALKANLGDLPKGGLIIANVDNFTRNNLRKAGYEADPLKDDSLIAYRVCKVPITTLHKEALSDFEGLSNRQVDMMKNFFALGLSYWVFDRPLDPTIRMLEKKFASKPVVVEANVRTMKAGYNYGETTEEFQYPYKVSKAPVQPGTYRSITGAEATAMGFVTAATKANRTLFYGSYPITPASGILEALAEYKNFDVRTVQAEDEIAAIGSTIGAAFGGALSATGTSGPGVALKSEAIGLAVVLELPLVIANIQRGGPSTGLPTKAEQSDLLQCFYGRNGECPVPIIAAATPTDCFTMGIEAFRIAVESMTPVFFMSDGYISTSSEPWKIPDPEDIPPIVVENRSDPEGFHPYLRDPVTLARPWAIPGTPGLEHRVGGLGKQDITGNVSYDADDHQHIVNTRAQKVANIADRLPLQDVEGPSTGDLLVVGWGGTYGALRSAVRKAQSNGQSVAHAHIRYLNPFPSNLGRILSKYRKVLVPELNMGQLSQLLNARYPVRVLSYPKVKGQPFKISEISDKINELLKG
ncbi:MAG TPA: 2-oxoglutarate ferredoxin oxidoreductase subunit alpha [Candidatus Latescibacteria bacterium]|nr:2-oxoglutarate ferredoxin oxidoreductase subunit alpha [Candidatus Latescibacterota bacterium]